MSLLGHRTLYRDSRLYQYIRILLRANTVNDASPINNQVLETKVAVSTGSGSTRSALKRQQRSWQGPSLRCTTATIRSCSPSLMRYRRRRTSSARNVGKNFHKAPSALYPSISAFRTRSGGCALIHAVEIQAPHLIFQAPQAYLRSNTTTQRKCA